MLFSYGYCWWQHQWWEAKHLICQPFQSTWRCAGAIGNASPNVACPGLLRKPLDATIGQLLTPYCPGGCQGDNQQNNDAKYPSLCWPFWLPWRCSGTIAHSARWRRFMAFIKATTCRHRTSTCSDSINRTCLPWLFLTFHHEKGSSWHVGP